MNLLLCHLRSPSSCGLRLTLHQTHSRTQPDAYTRSSPLLCGVPRALLGSDYKPAFMWWELLMLWRQLWLVGFAILIRPGTVEQLVICFLVVLSHMLLHAMAMPFKRNGDNYIGQVRTINFLMVASFERCADKTDIIRSTNRFNLCV